ncbi:RNA-binding domain-containing protein [Aulographum hederae CBS 113979]|uniref:RNA-binding domain-containing protein n=1 Tax=Aulographum hederae CBS 113979 TaxID=1176131 RepID=A0A6G1HG45_9PEZI|nr:RNA-binding domain-containing protein [Aulographum hederae CBS 113979]
MFLLRRSALRAFTAPTISIVAKPRTFITSTSSALRPKQQWIAPSFQKRFMSDEKAAPSEATATDETVTETPSEGEAEDKAAATSTEDIPQTPEEQAVGAVANDTPEAPIDAAPGSQSAPGYKGGERSPGAVYCGNLFFEVNEDDLRIHFEPYGEIESVKIIRSIKDGRTLSKGYGYVNFLHAEDAQKAIAARDQDVFQGRRMTVQEVRPRTKAPAGPTRTLFIGNISYDMSDKDLNDLFREVRNVLDVRVAIDRRTGSPRGFAHADFTDVAAAEKAMASLKDKEFYGRKLKVDFSSSSK